MRIETQVVWAFVKQSIIDDIQEMLVRFMSVNVVAKKELRSLIGKLNHAIGLLTVMRPVMDPLWAHWAAASPKRQPGCVWIKQVRTELNLSHTFSQATEQPSSGSSHLMLSTVRVLS